MKVIHIAPVAENCGEDSGEVPRQNIPLTRRSLLRGSGLLLGTLVAASITSHA